MTDKPAWQVQRDLETELARAVTRLANAYLFPHGLEARVVLYPLPHPAKGTRDKPQPADDQPA